MEKLQPSLSKLHNKMLKNIFEMLKIRKNAKTIKLKKIFLENLKFRKFEIPKIFGIPGISRNSLKVFENFPFSQVVENPRKRETLSQAASRTFCGPANGLVLLLFSSIGPLTSRKTIIKNPLKLFIFDDTLKRFNFTI